MYLGEYISPIGEKNRVALPKKLRESMRGEKLYLTRGYEGSLMLLEEADWQRLQDVLKLRPLLNMSLRDTKRFLLGGAVELSLDVQGRFILPEALMAYAEIDKSLTFIGVGEWIELWSTPIWNSKLNELKRTAAEIADRLESTKE